MDASERTDKEIADLGDRALEHDTTQVGFEKPADDKGPTAAWDRLQGVLPNG